MMIDECDYFATVCMCALWVNARLSNTLHWLPQRRKCDDDDDDDDGAFCDCRRFQNTSTRSNSFLL